MPNNPIVLFYDRLIAAGGAERLFLEEEQYLRSRGHGVITVVFEIDSSALFNYRPENLIVLGGRTHLGRVLRLALLIRRVHPALVVAPSNSEALYLYLVSRIVPSCRYVAHVHGSLFWFETDRLKYAFIHRPVFHRIRDSLYGHREFIPHPVRIPVRQRFALEILAILDFLAIRKARALIALTDQVAWEIELLYGRKSRVCRGCLRNDWLDSKERNRRDELGEDHGLVVFNVGRLDPRKRIDVLLRAFARARASRGDLRLVIGGVGPDFERLTGLAKQLGIDNVTQFCGFIPDTKLPSYYSCAAIFAFPSWTSSGITPYEALAFGCKVVWTSEADEPVLTWPGVYVADPTPEAFADKILEAAADSNQYSHPALRSYTWDEYFSAVERVLQDHLTR